MLKLCKISACSDGTLGLHLSRAPWDPYPWVSGVQEGSNAYISGIRIGDTVLKVNDFDVLGQKISDLATIIRSHWNNGGNYISFIVWSNLTEQNTINQQSVQKFATCLQNIAQLLECPICLEVVKPPGWQCCNGHVLCNSCRGRTTKCPICRVTLGPRGRCLLSDKLFTLLAETFPCDVKKDDNTISCPEHKSRKSIKLNTNLKHNLQSHVLNSKVDLKSTQNKLSNVEYKSYYCPTGKSSCTKFLQADIDYHNNNNNNNNNNNVKDNSRINETNKKLYNQWDILTHLQRVHQLSVTQYYGTYGERMDIELMNKSISCISIISERIPEYGILTNASSTPSSMSQQSANGIVVSHPDDTTLVTMSAGTLSSSKPFGFELFFVARIPIENIDGSSINDIDSDSNINAIPDGTKRCAIFIWYCGSEEYVKKFRAVIECKRSGIKWKGCIHSMTKSWNSIHRQKEFLQLQFDVANFFDIVIKIK